jgi:hypothetical protein
MHCQTLSFDIFLYSTISSGVTRNFSFAEVKFAATNIMDTRRHEMEFLPQMLLPVRMTAK